MPKCNVSSKIMLCFRTPVSEQLFQNNYFRTTVAEHMFQNNCFRSHVHN
jgi:hypothetical protein